MNLRSIDLNLLVILESLLRERQVTRAAARLEMSQPAVSRALGRLRRLFGDPLLIRDGRAYQLTPRAARLTEPVAAALRGIEELVRAEQFVPGEAEGVVRIGVPDHFALLFAPPLLERLAHLAPRLEVVFDSWTHQWKRRLEDGELALSFGPLAGNERQLHARRLVDDPWVCILRCGHRALGRWDLDQFVELEHGIMAVTGAGPGHVDRALADRGLARRLVFRASSPVVAAMVVADTELVVTTSELLAHYLQRRFEIEIRPVPLQVPALELPMVWHHRTHHDPMHRWVRVQIREVARAVRGAI